MTGGRDSSVGAFSTISSHLSFLQGFALLHVDAVQPCVCFHVRVQGV
jgi:hypothetical protein